MEPRIRYAKSSDGVSIAFWTIGEGKALIGVPTGPWGMEMESRNPGYRRWYERLARKRMVVLYDNRGTGLSGSEEDWSFESQTLDMDAVVNHLGLDSFALVGPPFGGPAAIAYAASHPERVTHLLLWCSWARTTDALGSPQAQAVLALIDKDWEVLTETLAHIVFGWSAGAEAHEVAIAFRENVSQEMMRHYLEALFEFDVTDLLPQLRPPTLVLHCRQSVFPGLDVAQGLASRIPNARLVLLEGSSVPWLDDMEAKARAFDEFLGDAQESGMGTSASGLVTILFTDIEGSTAHTQQYGDSKGQDLVRAHNTIVRAALKAHGGSEIKHTGDGIMASFPLASSAVECAIAIQQAVDAGAGEHVGPSLRVRIGLNAGEPVAEAEDLFGTAVQLAARICAHAGPGQILASNVVRELAAGKGVPFSGQQDVGLKGFKDSVRLHEVPWRQGYTVGQLFAKDEAPAVNLTTRETEVLTLLAGGYAGKEIAARLTISLSTVQRHIANIYAKIGARGRVDAVAYAMEHGIIATRSS